MADTNNTTDPIEEEEVPEVVQPQACPFASKSACKMLELSKENPELNYQLPKVMDNSAYIRNVSTAQVVGQQKPEDKKGNNTALIIGGAVLLVLIAIGVFFFLKNR